MVFSSIFFLLLFLPLVLNGLLLLDRRYHNLLILLASLLFYFWGEGFYLLLMLWSTAFNFAAGLAVSRWRSPWLMAAVVTVNLIPLVYFKYIGFLVGSLQSATGLHLVDPATLHGIHLPIGISFCTFHALSYVIDVYRRTVEVQRSPVRMGMYIALFPQLVAGPIIRYNEIDRQLGERTIRLGEVAQGVQRFVIGLAKKVVIANPMGSVADAAFALPPGELSFQCAWVGVIAYAIQIYFDFSAYSDMAIGLARMMGFAFPENFDYPYIARSIQEFWRRWHLSLSHWFRDYLYIPLGGNRGGTVMVCRNLLIVFLLCGLWHGANWTFVIWGLWHGLFLVLERFLGDRWLRAVGRPGQHAYALLAVLVGWVFFRAEDLAQAGTFLAAMAGARGFSGLGPIAYHLDPLAWGTLAAGILFSLPIGRGALAWIDVQRGRTLAGQVPGALVFTDPLRGAVLAGILLYCVAQLASNTYNPFIYFRF